MSAAKALRHITERLARLELAQKPHEQRSKCRLLLGIDQELDCGRHECGRVQVADRVGSGRVVGGEQAQEVVAVGVRDPREALPQPAVDVLEIPHPGLYDRAAIRSASAFAARSSCRWVIRATRSL